MKESDKIKRAVAFYFSVALFLILTPIILSYALGYKIDYRALKVYKTGIIYVNSHPSGASIYINGRYVNLSPTQIENLKPGTYRIDVKREGFYSWYMDVVVRPNMVTKLDRIILFRVSQEMKSVVDEQALDFVVSGKNTIYYFSNSGLYRSGMDGTGLKMLLQYSNWPSDMIGKKFSPDGNKILYFNKRIAQVIYLNPEKTSPKDIAATKVEEIFTSQDPIVEAFWHSGSGYIIIVTDHDIEVVELRGREKRNIAPLYKFNERCGSVYYDDDNDSIYFIDTINRSDGPRLYRLDLRQKVFENFMRLLLGKEPEPENGTR